MIHGGHDESPNDAPNAWGLEPDGDNKLPGRRAVVPNQPGVSPTVEMFAESPDKYLSRILIPGEVVLDQFDVYFPGKRKEKFNLLLCIIFNIAYLFHLCMTRLTEWCEKIKCCTPPLYTFVKGKVIKLFAKAYN